MSKRIYRIGTLGHCRIPCSITLEWNFGFSIHRVTATELETPASMSGRRRTSSAESPYAAPSSSSHMRAGSGPSAGSAGPANAQQPQKQSSSGISESEQTQSLRKSSTQEESFRRRSAEVGEEWSNIDHREIGGQHRYSVTMVERRSRSSAASADSERQVAADTDSSRRANTISAANSPPQQDVSARRTSRTFEDVDLDEDVATGNDFEKVDHSEGRGSPKYTEYTAFREGRQ